MKRKNNFKSLIMIVLLVLGLFVLTSCSYEVENKENVNTETIDASSLKYGLSLNEVKNANGTVSDEDSATVVANIVMPATVEITCTINFTYTYTSYGFGFGFGYGGSSSGRTVSSSESCQATGFFINEDGYLLTNAHVVTIESESSYPNLQYTSRDITINYADSDDLYTVEVVKYDTDLDLAVLKLTSDMKIENLKYVTFFNMTDPTTEAFSQEDAVKLYYGEYCVAVGNAQGYGISVTAGVVSAPYRIFTEDGVTTHAIQTDAAINEGNSGGPLCNKYGCVLGINSFKIVTSTTEGLGFAIPSYVVLDYIDTVSSETSTTIKVYVTNNRAYVA